MDDPELLTNAQAGDIRAFHTLFSEFQPQLKSYLYRLIANRKDMEDIAHDVFIIAFENIKSFRGEASLKTWVFTIATNHAKKHLKNQARWVTDTFERTRERAYAEPGLINTIDYTHQHAPQGMYEIREHIDYCFTCVSKMLEIKQQIALILKDIYGFKIKEVGVIMDASNAQIKHYLHNARKTMIGIFDETCALVNKNGICNQCSELNGKFNPKQDKRAEIMKIKWVKNRDDHTTDELYRLRRDLVKMIDPLQADGADLHDVLMRINHKVNV
ncbi:MAG: RNA polymerase sigma factor [Chloroflexi bacterium]|nr:MAG: RNA polymerase sigma factor [Chloroflexota bacterium]